MEEDPGSRMTGKTTQAAANEAVTPPTVPEHKRQGLASHQRGEQPKESTVKRKRDGEPTDPPRKKPREGGAKRGDELTSTGSSRSKTTAASTKMKRAIWVLILYLRSLLSPTHQLNLMS
jgi:hypothetical protein